MTEQTEQNKSRLIASCDLFPQSNRIEDYKLRWYDDKLIDLEHAGTIRKAVNTAAEITDQYRNFRKTKLEIYDDGKVLIEVIE